MTVFSSPITGTTTPFPLDWREFLRARALAAKALSDKDAISGTPRNVLPSKPAILMVGVALVELALILALILG